MPITWNDLTVSFKHLDRSKLVEDWQWLIGETALPILITSIGDMFLQETDGTIHWLMAGSAEYEQVAESYEEFQEKLKEDDLVDTWFVIPLVADLKENNIALEAGKLYGFKKLPILGGEYHIDNFELTDIEVHFALTGQMNFKIKDLPDGTPVNFEITE